MEACTGSPECCVMCCPCTPVGFRRLANSVFSAGSALITSELFSRVILMSMKEFTFIRKMVAALGDKGMKAM